MLQFRFFDHSDFLSHLSNHSDPLEKLNAAINWEAFRKPMNDLLFVERKSNAGRTPFDYVLMLKVLVLQSLYGLSDQQVDCNRRPSKRTKDLLDIMRLVEAHKSLISLLPPEIALKIAAMENGEI